MARSYHSNTAPTLVAMMVRQLTLRPVDPCAGSSAATSCIFRSPQPPAAADKLPLPAQRRCLHTSHRDSRSAYILSGEFGPAISFRISRLREARPLRPPIDQARDICASRSPSREREGAHLRPPYPRPNAAGDLFGPDEALQAEGEKHR